MTLQQIQDPTVVKKLFDDIAKRYKDDNKSGYTRIVAYRSRWGDGAKMAFIELNRNVLAEKAAGRRLQPRRKRRLPRTKGKQRKLQSNSKTI